MNIAKDQFGSAAQTSFQITLALKQLVDRQDLSEMDMRAAVGEIMLAAVPPRAPPRF